MRVWPVCSSPRTVRRPRSDPGKEAGGRKWRGHETMHRHMQEKPARDPDPHRRRMTSRLLAGVGLVLGLTMPGLAEAISLQEINRRLERRAPDGGRCGRYMRQRLATLPQDVVLRPDMERLLDRLASIARQRAGLPPLRPSDAARLAARAQAADMLLGGYVGHHSPSGCNFAKRFFAAAGAGHGSHGENAARDSRPGPIDAEKARRILRQWLRSGGHRRNLMNPAWRYVSTGAVARGSLLYAVQIYWQS